jgi:ABC-type polysaccharide/polyol phosphate export permease
VTNPSAAPKHTQARATVQILSTVRMIGTIGYALLTGIVALGTVIGTFTTSGSHIAFFFGGVVATVMIAIFGALFYATIGWLVETLSMLTEIAKNTARPAV